MKSIKSNRPPGPARLCPGSIARDVRRRLAGGMAGGLGLLLGLGLLVAGCSKSGPGDGTGAEAGGASAEGGEKVDYAAVDKELEADLKESSAEARAWLGVKANVIFEGSKAEVVQLTESFYKAGCPKVHITGIEKLGGALVSASMVVTLPTDPQARAAAFGIEKTFAAKEGEDGTPDRGQKYLLLTFD